MDKKNPVLQMGQSICKTGFFLSMSIIKDLTYIDQRKTNIIWYHLHVEFLKHGTNKLIYKTETDSQTYKTNLWLPKGKGGGGIN